MSYTTLNRSISWSGWLLLAAEGEAVGYREHHCLHAAVGGDHVVEGLDRDRVVVGSVGQHDPAAPEHVVDEQHAVRPEASQQLLVVHGVAGLVGVDEREVDGLLLGK